VCRRAQARLAYVSNREARLQQIARWRTANPDKTPEYQRRYRSKPEVKARGKERNRASQAYFRRWYLKNRLRALSNGAAWRAANPAKVKAYKARYSADGRNTRLARAWVLANPARSRELHYRRSARRRAAMLGNVAAAVDRLAIYARDGWRCQICGKGVNRNLRFPDPMSASLGHIIPVSLGGAHIPSNVRLEHLRCNIRYGQGRFAAQLLLLG
jgi:5-methylcytosine-specific restriction endonuclease McrA